MYARQAVQPNAIFLLPKVGRNGFSNNLLHSLMLAFWAAAQAKLFKITEAVAEGPVEDYRASAKRDGNLCAHASVSDKVLLTCQWQLCQFRHWRR